MCEINTFNYDWLYIAALTCPPDYSPYASALKCIRIISSFEDRDNSESTCEADNGHLASITSSEENAFIISIVPSYVLSARITRSGTDHWRANEYNIRNHANNVSFKSWLLSISFLFWEISQSGPCLASLFYRMVLFIASEYFPAWALIQSIIRFNVAKWGEPVCWTWFDRMVHSQFLWIHDMWKASYGNNTNNIENWISKIEK